MTPDNEEDVETPEDFRDVVTPEDFFAQAKTDEAEMVDLKFTDMLGTWQHCSYPIDTWDEGTFENGVGFDGSSIRGWQGIHQSDMLAVPDATTYRIDPFFERPTVSVRRSMLSRTITSSSPRVGYLLPT